MKPSNKTRQQQESEQRVPSAAVPVIFTPIQVTQHLRDFDARIRALERCIAPEAEESQSSPPEKTAGERAIEPPAPPPACRDC